MLTPDQIQRIADRSVLAIASYNLALKEQAARALANLEAAELREPPRKTLLDTVEADVTSGVTTALTTDEARYAAARNAGLIAPFLPLAESKALSDALLFGVGQAQSLTNLTATRAKFAVQQTLYDELDRATLAISTGAKSKQAAIADAVSKLAQTDTVVTFPTPTGVRQMNLYSAVRTAVQTTTSRWAGNAVSTRLGELGFQFVEVSAHSDARPDHAEWQGQVYGFPDELEAVTGYPSDPLGLMGIGCRHFLVGHIPGFSEPAFDDVEYDPELYEASQELRRTETKIRKYKERQSVREAALRVDPTNERLQKQVDADKQLVRKWQGNARSITSRSGLRRQYDRERASR